MQVPDRITVSGGGVGNTNSSSTMGGFRGGGGAGVPDFGSNSSGVPGGPMMTVPDRILLAGNNAHVAARGTTRPRELQLEKSIVPNHSPEHVRVYTPPRSIRLDDNSAFPSAARLAGTDFSDDELSSLEQSAYNPAGPSLGSGAGQRIPSSANFQRANSSGGLLDIVGDSRRGTELALSTSLGKDSVLSSGVGGGRPGGVATPVGAADITLSSKENMTPFEELQLVRRQIAKLNHRLMAVELENQQQQQREMLLTALVTAYFFGKFIFWVNRDT